MLEGNISTTFIEGIEVLLEKPGWFISWRILFLG
jgi:hypothetical protein